MIDFNEKLARKEGRVTPKALLQHALDNIDDIDAIVFVATNKEGLVKTGYSDVSQLQIIGMLESGKSDVINDMYE